MEEIIDMNIIRSIIRYLTDADYRFIFNVGKGLYRKMPDKKYLKRRFHVSHGYYMDFDNPQTFSEKLQWLKLHDRNPLYTKLVDKVEVKQFIERKIGQQYLIPTIGVWNSVEDIDFDLLPIQFVIKCTHDSHGLIICKDKTQLDIAKTRAKLKAGLKKNYYYSFREWPYKNVKPRIMAEPYLSNNGEELIDYKVHCFNGKAKLILVCEGRFSSRGLTEDFYDCEWNHLDIRRPKVPNTSKVQEKPEQLAEMIQLAEILSRDIPFVRVDFYIIDRKVFFGEMTFYPASGLTPFVPNEWDRIIGKWLDLNIERDK